MYSSNERTSKTSSYSQIEEAAPSADFGFYSIGKRLGKAGKHIRFTGKLIVDIGCAQGAYTIEMAKKAKFVVGVDIQHEALKVFMQKRISHGLRNLSAVNMRVEKLGFRNEYFDIVTLIEVIEHVKDEKEALRECYRILKKGGYIVISAPNRIFPFETHQVRIGRIKISRLTPLVSWLPRKTHRKISSARNYLARDLSRSLSDCGFKLKAVDYIFPPLDRLRLPPFLKSVYRRIMDILERTPLRIFGVSVLVVGEKEG